MNNMIMSNTTSSINNLVTSFLSGRKNTTIEAYRRDLLEFSHFLQVDTINIAAKTLISLSLGEANAIALNYKNSLIEKRFQSSTINRKLASLRSLVNLAQTLGLVNWELQVPNMEHEPYRDVRGVGESGIFAIFEYLRSKEDIKSIRDNAIFHLLFLLGLRRQEVCNLEMKDLELNSFKVSVLGKGKIQKQFLTLPGPCIEALRAWIDNRGESAGPLFYRLDKASGDARERLTGTGLYHIVKSLGKKVGLETTVHKIRHDSITTALKVASKNNLGLEQVRKFSRHADIRTVLIYNDSVEDSQGAIADLVSTKILGGTNE